MRQMGHTVENREGRVNYRCTHTKGCPGKASVVMHFAVHTTIDIRGHASEEWVCYETYKFNGGYPRCLLCPVCGIQMNPRRVEGHADPNEPCDGRCTGAIGHICNCSCGGKNHGSRWG